MKSRVALLAGLFLTCAAFAQELTDPVPILIPIHVGGHLPGAFGSAWATNVHVFNSSPGGVVYFGGGCNLGVICPTFRTVTSQTSYPLTIYRGNPGYLLWVSRSDERNVHVAARLFETTRNAIPGGVA
ncbi:MAG TPA: hypothetical protein VFV54_06525, partial [Thermoanaerobaculia bacterium]|nr:hypothetical protein [Thermoanaerobaculia bacterium]